MSPARPAGVPSAAVFDQRTRRWVVGETGADSRPRGAWTWYRADGSRYREERHVGGEIEGPVRWWHPDGTIARVDSTVDGAVRRSVYHRCETETDLAAPLEVAPAVSVVVARGDDAFTWREIRCFDGDQRPLTPGGEAVPPRPAGVPATAVFVGADDPLLARGPPPHWADGARERGTLQPVGEQRIYSASGVLLEIARYDNRGRLLYKRGAHHADPQRVALHHYCQTGELGVHGFRFLDAEVHAAASRAIAARGPGFTIAYGNAIPAATRRGGRVLEPPPAWQLTRDLATAALGSRSVEERRAVPQLQTALYELRDGARLRELWADDPDRLAEGPRSLFDLDDDDVSDLGLEVRAAFDGLLSPRVVLRAATGGAALIVGDQDVDVRLGSYDPGAECAPARFWDGQTLRATPFLVDAYGPSYARYVQRREASDERLLLWSGRHGWWLWQRYGRDVLISGSRYDAGAERAVPRLDLWLTGISGPWLDTLCTLFRTAAPPDARAAPRSGDRVWVRLYRNPLQPAAPWPLLAAAPGRVLAGTLPVPRGIWGWSRSAPLPRLGAALQVLEEWPKPVAEERLDHLEVRLFQRGLVLAGIEPLPAAELPDA